jgi:hypothetical protein
MILKICLLISALLFAGCVPQPQECPKYKQQLFPLQDYNTSDRTIGYWKEGDENGTFVITTEDDFKTLIGDTVYCKESLKGLITNINTYNDHINTNNKE